MSEEQRRQLRQQLWNIADSLRGKMHADEFRDYMLGFIFYKYLSEKIGRFADQILKEDGREFASLDEKNADDLAMIEAVKEATVEELGYFLRPSELFHAIALKGNNKKEGESSFIIPDLMRIFNSVEQSTQGTESEDKFVNLFEDLREGLKSSKLGNSEKDKNEAVVKILNHIDQIDFQLDNIEADVLGDAYEYLIGQFASGAGKKAGEFYTPQEVSTVLSKLVTCQKKIIKNAYDPTCGSGSLLLRVKKEASKEYKIKIYGQESNRTTYNLARMNMILHDVHYDDFDIRQEDTLENPLHLRDPQLKDLRFDAIVANPPFSANWSANPLFNQDDRFGVYGKLAPSTKADMAFVQHMIFQLAEDGVMAVVLPHGVLFRGAAEGHIRQYLIEQMNYLDAVIGLPANIFYGTSIPTCILVFKKCRKNPDDVLFIDASQDFEKVKTQNKLLPVHIDRIISAYQNRTNEPKYSHVASLADIKANDYNLNIPRYVDTFEEEERVDLEAVAKELEALDGEIKATDEKIADFCKQLNISLPF